MDHPAFVAAQRHTRHVRWLRRAIPLALMLSAAWLGMRVLQDTFSPVQAENTGFRVEGRKIIMESPRLSGYKRDGQAYELTANSATQDLSLPTTLDLDRIKARMQTGTEGWADFTGLQGIYDSKSEKMNVTGQVNVRTQSGLDARMKDAKIEFKTGTIITQQPVEVSMPQGDVDAERMQVFESGKRLVFEGRVRSTFVNGAPVAPAQPLAKPSPYNASSLPKGAP